MYEQCSNCHAPISTNQQYWSLQYAIEIFDGHAVQVRDAVAVAYFCEHCASERDFDHIQVPLKQHHGS
jgi:hypothetical protein